MSEPNTDDLLLSSLQESMDPATTARLAEPPSRPIAGNQASNQASLASKPPPNPEPPPEPERIVVHEVNVMARLPQDVHDQLRTALFNDGRLAQQSFFVGAVRAYLDDPVARSSILRRMPKRGER